MIFTKNYSEMKTKYYELDLYRKPVTITMIPTSIVKGAKNPIKPSGFCPTIAMNIKLIANITNPTANIIRFCLENLS